MRTSHHVLKRWLVVIEATTYTRIYGQQQLGKCWCTRVPTNATDRYVVVVPKEETITGHLPRQS